MKDLLLLGTGGALGAISRYYLGVWIASRLGNGFPYGTLTINVTGCLFLGFFSTLALDRAAFIPPELRLFLAVGFTGAYTTFSTFGVETIRLLEDGNLPAAGLYVLASVGVGLLAVYLGVIAARLIP